MILRILEELRKYARVFGTKESTMIARQIWKAEKKFLKENKYMTTSQLVVHFPEINSNSLFYAYKGGRITGKKVKGRFLFKTSSVLKWHKSLMKRRGEK